MVPVALTGIMALSLAVGFGIFPGDLARLRNFADAVGRWQHEPDFRQVQAEYVELGHRAMTVHVSGIPAAKLVMALRSVPGLPDDLRVNPTSARHYQAFTRGPLSAYLHLAREQGTAYAVAMLEDLARHQPLGDEDCRAFLKSFKLPWPVATDAGAIASLRGLMRDTDASKPFAIRTNPTDLLRAHVIDLARRRHLPAELEQMTAVTQDALWHAFDEDLHERDPELWRTKQLNDFLAGIWAQSYGQVYVDLINGVLLARRIGQIVVAMIIVGLVGSALIGRFRARTGVVTAS